LNFKGNCGCGPELNLNRPEIFAGTNEKQQGSFLLFFLRGENKNPTEPIHPKLNG